MTNPISQAAVDAVKAALLNEGCLDREHYPDYQEVVATIVLEAAMPHICKQIAEEIRAQKPARYSNRRIGKTAHMYLELAALTAEEGLTR